MKACSDIKYRLVYALVILLSGAMAVRMSLHIDLSWFYLDYFTFLSAADRLSSGHLDVLRTPVYPLLIALTEPWTSDPMAPYALLGINISLHLCSVEAFRRICLCLGIRRWPGMALTAVYALLPGIVAWAAIPNSDGPGISLTVIWLWLTVRDAPDRIRPASALCSALLWLILVLLRPIFVCLLPIVLLRWGYVLFRGNRRAGTIGLATLVAAVTVLALYRAEIHRLYNIDSFTHVTALNNYYLVCEHGVISDEDAITEAQRRGLALTREFSDTTSLDPLEIDVGWQIGFYPMPPDELEDIVGRTVRRDPGGIAATLWIRWTDRFTDEEALRGDSKGLDRIYSMTIGTLVFFYLLTALIFIASGRPLTFPIRSWTVWLTGAAVIATSFLGAWSYYARLIAPAIAPSLILLGLALSLFHFKKSADEKLG